MYMRNHHLTHATSRTRCTATSSPHRLLCNYFRSPLCAAHGLPDPTIGAPICPGSGVRACQRAPYLHPPPCSVTCLSRTHSGRISRGQSGACVMEGRRSSAGSHPRPLALVLRICDLGLICRLGGVMALYWKISKTDSQPISGGSQWSLCRGTCEHVSGMRALSHSHQGAVKTGTRLWSCQHYSYIITFCCLS